MRTYNVTTWESLPCYEKVGFRIVGRLQGDTGSKTKKGYENASKEVIWFPRIALNRKIPCSIYLVDLEQ